MLQLNLLDKVGEEFFSPEDVGNILIFGPLCIAVLLKSGVDGLGEFELRLLLKGWKKEISLESENGKHMIVAHYVNPQTNKSFNNLDDVKALFAERSNPAVAGDSTESAPADRVSSCDHQSINFLVSSGFCSSLN